MATGRRMCRSMRCGDRRKIFAWISASIALPAPPPTSRERFNSVDQTRNQIRMVFPARATADSTAGACSRQLQRHVRIARHACVPPHFLPGCVGARRILQRRDVRVRQRGPRSPGRQEAAPPAAEVSSESFESLAFAPSMRHVDAVACLLRVVSVAVRVAAARRGAPPVHVRGPRSQHALALDARFVHGVATTGSAEEYRRCITALCCRRSAVSVIRSSPEMSRPCSPPLRFSWIAIWRAQKQAGSTSIWAQTHLAPSVFCTLPRSLKR